MSKAEELINREYQYGFVTEIEADTIPPGLSEDVIRVISTKKNEPPFMLEWRLNAYRRWLTMKEPQWQNIHHLPIDYQKIIYYSAPKKKKLLNSLDDVDQELLKTFEKLGIPLEEQKRLAGVAVDAVFDSVSVATTFKKKLEELGIIFCSFSEAVQNHPQLIQKYLGSVVPYNDNFYAALNSAVFSDGSFCYIPKGVRCPMELSTYFRINSADTGQFERTLIIAEEGAYVSYLEGCLPRWEQVSLGHTMKPVVDVAVGDTVLNSHGKEDVVSKITKRRYRGDLLRIIPRSPGNQFELTPEHPVLAIKRGQVRSSLRPGNRWADIHKQKLFAAQPAYTKAGELAEGDLLVFPIPKKQKNSRSLSDAFLSLLGYYVSEGCATKFNGYDALEFSFGIHETKNIREAVSLIKKVIGKTPSVAYDRKRNGAYIVVYSKEWVGRFVEHGGKYADGKRLSQAVMDLPPARQKLFLESYYKGDGSVSCDGNLKRVRATTVSKELAFQLQELWTRQGRFAYLNIRDPYEEVMKDGRTISHKRKYTLFYAEKTRGQRALRRKDYFLIPIRRIERRPFDDFVYNFETRREPHSYLVKGFAVHNCTAPIRDKNQLHAAVVELIALENAQIKYSTIQNWYAGDREGKGGIYNFVTKRGKCAGPHSKISWTQVETGAAITWKYPSVILQGDNSIGEFYSVALTNNFQQADTGTKMIHIGKNTKSTIISKGIAAGHGNNSYRGLVKVLPKADHVRNYTQCDSLLLGDKCAANTFPYIEVQNRTAKVEHEATTSKISEDQLFYCNSRGISGENAVSMIVNGFCKEVFKNLPMEFAVEANKLLGVSLEGAIA